MHGDGMGARTRPRLGAMSKRGRRTKVPASPRGLPGTTVGSRGGRHGSTRPPDGEISHNAASHKLRCGPPYTGLIAGGSARARFRQTRRVRTASRYARHWTGPTGLFTLV